MKKAHDFLIMGFFHMRLAPAFCASLHTYGL